ncbi:DUF262 domain-containing protein [Helicobacter cetorum]|uniref:DUF262 domain-containing protein n=1 Tax=Helicobacter cetorum TaxID=138563 RepID=UPI000CF047D6|nr:DUF262 domain-containing protein [Helicobacter cetorum]
MDNGLIGNLFVNYGFSIPNYQRDYAWTKQQLEDLWEDLEESLNSNDTGHYLGTIVITRNQDTNKYDLIDGQQRCTTLFMLRFLLCHKINPIYYTSHFYDEEGKLKFQVISANESVFSQILEFAKTTNNIDKLQPIEKECATIGQKRLLEVFKTIYLKIKPFNEEQAKKYLQTLDKMKILILKEESPGKAIRVFSSVNDRGVPLKILDKLKALLILYSNKFCNGVLDAIIDERFGKIFKNAQKITETKVVASMGDKVFRDYIEDRLFTYHAYGLEEKFSHHENSVKIIYEGIKFHLKGIKKSEDLLSWLDNYSKDFLDFTQAFLEITQKSEKNLELFKLLFILKINPYFYAPLVRMHLNNLLDDESILLFAQAHIMLYTLGSSNDGTASKLKNKVCGSKEKFIQAILGIIQKAKKGYYSSTSKAIEDMHGITYNYADNRFHYLFHTYHKTSLNILLQLVGKTFNATLEHIAPQNAMENGTYIDYDFKTEDEFSSVLHTFGNFLSLESSLNSKAKDKSYLEKKEIYKESVVPFNQEFAHSNNDFKKENIQKTNQEFLEWLKEDFFKNIL